MPHARTARAVATAVTLRAALVEASGGEQVDGHDDRPAVPGTVVRQPALLLGRSRRGHLGRQRPPGGPGGATPSRTGCASTTASTPTTGPSRSAGNPIEYWLHNPTLYFEPPHVAAHRMWRGVAEVGAGRAGIADGAGLPPIRPRCARSWPPRWVRTPVSPTTSRRSGSGCTWTTGRPSRSATTRSAPASRRTSRHGSTAPGSSPTVAGGGARRPGRRPAGRVPADRSRPGCARSRSRPPRPARRGGRRPWSARPDRGPGPRRGRRG